MAGHWGGSGWGALPAINIFLFSLMHGGLRFTSGGIPAAWGFHFAWNSLYLLAGAPLTGEKFQIPFVEFVDTGPGWLSGGLYGPEGSVVSSIVLIVALFFIQRYLKHQSSADISGQNNPIRKSEVIND
jgi:hypothetical protein